MLLRLGTGNEVTYFGEFRHRMVCSASNNGQMSKLDARYLDE
jgi:hypothetical protein